MRAGVVLTSMLISILVLAGSAFAAHEKVQLGPYNISFNMNTSEKYAMSTDGPSYGTANGVKFTVYNLSIDSKSSSMFVELFGYGTEMLAGYDANREIVEGFLQQNAGCERVVTYKVIIDGHQGILGGSQSCNIPQNLLACASYSPDATVISNEYKGRINCEMWSTFPWETTLNMINSLHVQVNS